METHRMLLLAPNETNETTPLRSYVRPLYFYCVFHPNHPSYHQIETSNIAGVSSSSCLSCMCVCVLRSLVFQHPHAATLNHSYVTDNKNNVVFFPIMWAYSDFILAHVFMLCRLRGSPYSGPYPSYNLNDMLNCIISLTFSCQPKLFLSTLSV